LTRTYIYINKSLYLLKVRRLRQKISFPQIQSMAGNVIAVCVRPLLASSSLRKVHQALVQIFTGEYEYHEYRAINLHLSTNMY
jgi:hypothetical protein